MFSLDQQDEKYGILPLENTFITNFLPSARGDQIRVYLMGLYLSRHPREGYTLTEMAKDLHMEENDVAACFRYWERRGLVSQVRQDPPEYVFYSALERSQRNAGPIESDEAYVEFAESVYSVFGSRRSVTSSEIARAWEWVADMGLTSQVVLMLINHLITSRGVNFTFDAAEKIASQMGDEKITTPEDAEAFFAQDAMVRDGARKLLRHMGKRREASMDEIQLYHKWTSEWHFSAKAIAAACSEMTAGDPSFAYLNSILERLYTGKAVSEEDLRGRLDTEKQKKAQLRELIVALGVNITAQAFEPIYDKWLELYPHSVIMLAAGECRSLRTGRVEKCEEMLESWKNRRGLLTEEAIRSFLEEHHRISRAMKDLFEKMDMTGNVTEKDRELYREWKKLGFSDDMLALAAERSRQAAGRKLSYMDSILRSWQNDHITTPQQAAEKDRDKARNTAAKPAAPQGNGKVINALNYDQRNYSKEEMDALNKRIWQEMMKDD